MSRKFGVIDSGFWRSRKLRGASDQARLLCVYLISCPHGNSVGLFHIPLAYIQADLGWSEKQVRIQVSELVSRRILEFDFEYDLVRFIGWWQHNPIDNGKHGTHIARQMVELQCDSEVFRNHLKALGEYAAESGKPFLRHLIPGPDTGIDTGIDTGVPRARDNTDTDTDTKSKRAAPTGPADLKALIFSRGVSLLMAKGTSEDHARAFFGKAIATTSVGDVLEAVGKCEREDPMDPKAFIRGVLKPKIRPNGFHPPGPQEARRAKSIADAAESECRKHAEEQARAEGLHPMTAEGRARVVEIMRTGA